MGIILSMLALPVFADSPSSIGIMVNNKIVSSDTAPVYSDGVVMVRAKEFIETIGATYIVDKQSSMVTAKYGGNELVLKLDDSTAKLNGKYVKSPAPLKIIDYRYMVPAEFVAKSLGAEVYMNTYKNIIMIFLPDNGNLVYKVLYGDTLWIISNVFGTSVDSLTSLNSLKSDMIYPGMPIIVKKLTFSNTIIQGSTSNSATLFSGPGFSYSASGYVKAWTPISILGKDGDWYKVSISSGNGYMHSSVVYIKQDISYTPVISTYFTKEIPVDTSADFITFNTYTVQRGDSIWSISQSMGMPDYELANVNGMIPTQVLYPGQTLKVPVHNIPVKKTAGYQYGEILDWFKEAQYLFPIGKTGKFIDMETGKSFMAKRTMGSNHSDTETLTAQDTQTMKDIFGGTWSWVRRPFILEVDGRRFAISVAGMPHAGVDGAPFLKDVANRSDNWGTGPNYDSITGNGMDGHFDVYFLNCLRHVDNKMDPQHQLNVMISGGLR